ncbi:MULTISPECIES: ubiquinol-cytochrome c reductase iron-sulfur subunit [Nocardiopsidaceae]|jgi:ubiquinol-cytochrome c reductase iron-sulfur subunit|uniref:Cytochrome bc1 complex Rieske iron-sulfur subunit n=2 Tax=Nocardiopsidaceae TaxID=83676 RepID=A0ABY6YS99_9ACTN|nr:MULTISPECIES: Rieske 2Fe-2S domain-containing protein [Nocardiopsaceae]MEE2042936.1 Rieske 2Fe-2S domain-containing protein [Nocardiopsis tropica]MEE2055022.1 Rieske 2Fe-2S domain-containing protein [Nocardiopsis umidischolae]WAE75115.1 Rieske 2Fe-2S domain-containing protein [Streptomonospora nanhaiensis]
MTENDNNDNNEAGAHTPERVVGTPTAAAEERVVTESSAGAPEEHAGPYRASETHARPEEVQRRGEKAASAWFIIAFLGGIGFLVSYFLFPPNAAGEPAIADPQIGQYSNMLLGGTLTVAMFGIGAGMTVWARQVMPHYEVHSPYDDLASDEKEKGSFSDFFMKSADESGFTKRPLMRRTLILAMVPLGLAPIVLLRDTGPLPGDKLKHTPWEPGMRMFVEGTHREIRAEDLENDPYGMISALPAIDDGHHPHGMSLTDQAKSVILLIKIPENDWKEGMTEPIEGTDETRLNWTHNGIIAYSKICTHVGCPAALYERTTHRILCPCHQSTFDAADAAKVVFGPAHRALPQLPISVDDEGYLIATGDFTEPTGPTFWDYAKD